MHTEVMAVQNSASLKLDVLSTVSNTNVAGKDEQRNWIATRMETS